MNTYVRGAICARVRVYAHAYGRVKNGVYLPSTTWAASDIQMHSKLRQRLQAQEKRFASTRKEKE